MLSILIPVYNFDIRNLVKELNFQCLDCGISYEIICLDDGSFDQYKNINREIKKIKNVTYEELANNLGRSKIRNVLGKRAAYDFLIFMDCDSQVINKNYISNYINHLKTANHPNEKKSLLYGGRCYHPTPPVNPNHLFHWTFGIHREQSTPNQRNQKPYHSFMTNNFLVPKEIFLDIQFDESLTQYGHEDTLFGLELKNRNVSIIHLDNPLLHNGLEETEVFVGKSKKAIQNLFVLKQKGTAIETRLLQYFIKTQELKLVWLIKFIFQIVEKQLVKNFKSKNPNLKLFDFYKLGYLCSISSKKSI